MFERPLMAALALAIGAGAGACSLKVPGAKVRVQVELPQRDAVRPGALKSLRPSNMRLGPPTVQSLDCIFLNVVGPGISDDLGPGGRLQFLDLGVTSTPVSPAEGAVTIRVPSGVARTIQVLGTYTGTGSCPGGLVTDVLTSSPRPELYEIGRTTTSLFQDSTVTVQNQYDGGYDYLQGLDTLVPLAYGFSTVENTNSFSGFNGTFPPSGSTDLSSSGYFSELIGLKDTTSIAFFDFKLAPTAGQKYPRLDFGFDASGLTIGTAARLRVETRLGNSVTTYSGGNCSQIFSGFGGAELRVYNASGGFYSAPLNSSSSSAALLNPLTLDNAADYLQTYLGSPIVHVAILGTGAADAGTPSCSNVLIDLLKVTLLP